MALLANTRPAASRDTRRAGEDIAVATPRHVLRSAGFDRVKNLTFAVVRIARLDGVHQADRPIGLIVSSISMSARGGSPLSQSPLALVSLKTSPLTPGSLAVGRSVSPWNTLDTTPVRRSAVRMSMCECPMRRREYRR